MSILLLGETGFLGQEVSNLLFKKKTHSCKIDLSKIKLISNILKKKKPDIIINCAVVANFKSNYSKKMLTINFLAVKKLVDYCVNNKKTLIQVSGTIVHPLLKNYNKNSKIKPKSFYGKTKFFADKFIVRNKKKLDFKIIRFGGIYGRDGADHLYINQLISGQKNFFNGNTNSVKNYIHVKDAAKCIKKLCKIKKKGIYYAGGEVLSFKKMIVIIQKKNGKKIIIKPNKEKKTSEIVKTSKIFKIKSFGFHL
jgi:dTDP-4-dehydrorhamnose reductase